MGGSTWVSVKCLTWKPRSGDVRCKIGRCRLPMKQKGNRFLRFLSLSLSLPSYLPPGCFRVPQDPEICSDFPPHSTCGKQLLLPAALPGAAGGAIPPTCGREHLLEIPPWDSDFRFLFSCPLLLILDRWFPELNSGHPPHARLLLIPLHSSLAAYREVVIIMT